MVNIKTENTTIEVPGAGKQLGPIFQDEKWLEYRRKWDTYPKEGIVGKVPLQIDLFAVDICNLKCPMCPRQDYIPGKGYMSFDVVKKILDDATEHGLCAFNFGGLGEPTLYPDLFKVIAYAKEKGVVDVNMHTNGTRLDHDFNRQLLDSGLDRLIISLDSAKKEVYEKIRVGAQFEKVYAAVEDLLKQRKEHPTARMHIKANFIEMNEDDPDDKNAFLAYWSGKVDRISILRYLDCRNGEEGLFHKQNYVQDNAFCCGELWRRLVIWSDGTATVCFRDIKRRVIVGNIHEQSVTEIWTGEKLQRIRDAHRQGEFMTCKLCADCPDTYDSIRSR